MTREQIEEIANVVLKAAGSGFQHYMPSSKERILNDLEDHLAATGRLNGLNLSNSTPLEITTDHDVRPAVPEGYVLVPIEPTDEMMSIGKQATNPFFVTGACLPTDNFPVHAIYKSMIAAAPKQGD